MPSSSAIPGTAVGVTATTPTAVTRAKALKAGALMIYAEPSAEGFYKQMGAIRIVRPTV